MPHFPIVDTHVHLMDPKLHDHPGLAEGMPQLMKTWAPADFSAAAGSVEIDKIVFMEVVPDRGQEIAEARWVASLAQADPRIEGIVARAPLEEDESTAGQVLDGLKRIPMVRGIRRLIQGEAAGFALQPQMVANVRRLAEYDMSFDICIHHPQLAESIELVEQCPEVSFILDHIGKPDIKAGTLEPWKTELRRLASLPNVVCKVSGVATEADWDHWTDDDVRPYLDHVIDCFGFDRLVYGGDWFVASLATTYPRWVETIDRVLEGCSDLEKRKLFRDNAIAFYRLG